jgi:hypothetical protein
MKTPHRDVTTLDPSARVSDGGDVPPLHVRALDAFEAFYRQLAVVSQCMAELRTAFGTDSIPWVVLTAASLNSALGVLYARLELLEVVTNDQASRELWTHPMMELMRSQLRALLEDGTAYASRHPRELASSPATAPPFGHTRGRVEDREGSCWEHPHVGRAHRRRTYGRRHGRPPKTATALRGHPRSNPTTDSMPHASTLAPCLATRPTLTMDLEP